MTFRLFLTLLCTGLLCGTAIPGAAREYHDEAALRAALRETTRDGSLFTLSELARDASGRPIHLVQVGSGDPGASAVLLVAGLDGRHLVGTEMAVALLEELASDADATRSLLGNRTLYVVPRVNHHGAAAFFSRTLRREVAGLEGAGDHDKDGLVGEDPVDDLNADGAVTLVRVRDAAGDFVLDGDEEDFPRKAKVGEGEFGAWRVLGEGRDDDGDEAWNEEADGGVNVARSFTHGYAWFARDTGAYQVSTPEARAVADFLAGHANIAAVLVFGFEDNLLTPWSDSRTSDPNLRASRFGRKPVTEPNQDDVTWLRRLSDQYREDLGVAKAKDLGSGGPGVEYGAVATGATTGSTHAAEGGLAAYAYYARGRTVLATPVWTPALQLARNDEAKGDDSGEDADPSEGGPEGGGYEGGTDVPPDSAKVEAPRVVDDTVQQEQAFRDWLVSVDPGGWLGWQPIDHPDFPGQETLVGGFAPFAKINPPVPVLEELVPAHVDLVKRLFETDLPRVGIRETKLRSRGAGIYELVVEVANSGYLPDVLAQGVYSTHVRDTRVELDLPPGGEILGGPDRVMLDRIPGSGGAQEARFLLRVPDPSGTVTVRVVSEVAGTATTGVRVADAQEGSR